MEKDFYPQKIYVKMFFKDGTTKRCQSASSNKIYRKIKANKFEKGIIKVSYGKKKSASGKIEEFDNESLLMSKSDLLKVFSAFLGR